MVYRSVIPPICLHLIWHFCCICFGGGVGGEKMLCSVRYTRVVYSQQWNWQVIYCHYYWSDFQIILALPIPGSPGNTHFFFFWWGEIIKLISRNPSSIINCHNIIQIFYSSPRHTLQYFSQKHTHIPHNVYITNLLWPGSKVYRNLIRGFRSPRKSLYLHNSWRQNPKEFL